jgi:hypothetical protein
MAERSPAQIERLRQGNRADLDRITGTQLHDLPAVERTIGRDTDWNFEKLGQLHGGAERDNVVAAVGANRRMRDTYQRIDQGSQTAPRLANEKAFDGIEISKPDSTATGISITVAQRLAKALMGISRETTKDQVATLMSKAGPEAQAIAENLLRKASDTTAGAKALGRLLSNPAYLGASSPASGRR